MELTPREVDELLGAWALDALDPDEMDAVAAAIARDPDLARRAAALSETASRLAPEARGAPSGLRDGVLRVAVGRPRPPDPAAPPIDVYADQVAALRGLLDELTDAEWRRPARPYEWTVHGLVAHLLVIERYTATQLGFGGDVPARAESHLGAGRDQIAEALRSPPAHTADAWHATAAATIARLRGGDGPAPDATMELHGWPFTADSLLIARGFEIWTHADDIRRATGRALVTPSATVLRTMSRFSVTSLPLVMPLVAPARHATDARVVLTGDGGGTFDLGDPARRRVLVVADIVDYCRVAARRLDPGDLDAVVEGEADLARDLLAAAQVFAV